MYLSYVKYYTIQYRKQYGPSIPCFLLIVTSHTFPLLSWILFVISLPFSLISLHICI